MTPDTPATGEPRDRLPEEPRPAADPVSAPRPATASTPTAAAVGVAAEPRRRSHGLRLEHPFVLGFLLTLGGLAAYLLGMTLSSLSSILVYIAFALFIALGLDPVVRRLTRRGLSRAWSVVITIVSFVVVLGGLLALVLPTAVQQVTLFVQSVPSLVDGFTHTEVYTRLEDVFGPGFQSLIADVTAFLTDPGNIAAIGGGALQVGASVLNGVSGAIVVLVLTIYFVASLPSITSSLVRLTPARSRESVSSLTAQIIDSIGGYLGGMAVLAAFNAIVVGVLFAVLGLPFPLLMAVAAFCITLIPLVGSVLFWAIGSALALFTSPISALIFAAVYLVYMQIEAYVLTPRVMSRAISVPGSLVVIGALVGGSLLGLLGALVAIPVTASILLIVKQVWIPRQDAKV